MGVGSERAASGGAGVAEGEVEDLVDGVIGGERSACLGDFAELIVERLDRVRIGYEMGGRSGAVEASLLGSLRSGSGCLEEQLGQADLLFELRARVSTWPPLRPARLRCERESVFVVSARWFLTNKRVRKEMVRHIGMDVHRSFAQIAVVEDGLVRDEGKIGVKPEDLREWADTFLKPSDEVALEATTNSDAIATMLRGEVARVVVSNPRKTRAIAEAKVKTDKVDARILAQLLAADFLPETWVADDQTRYRRRLVARRTHLVRHNTRLKNQVHAILSRNLVPTCPHSKLFSGVGLRWLDKQTLPDDEWRSVRALLRHIDFCKEELAEVDHDIAVDAIDDAVIARLMTIPGINITVAMSVIAAVGDFSRFESPDRLVSYLGLNPRVSQSGNSPAKHGRITKAGRAQARGMLVEAAFSASRAPGPLRAFYRRIKDRRGFQVATVATARKMIVLCWHLITKEEDYAFARPSLVAHKRRSLELAAGAQSKRGPVAGPSHDYHIKELRDAEKALVEQEERAYEVLVAHWQPQKPDQTG